MGVGGGVDVYTLYVYKCMCAYIMFHCVCACMQQCVYVHVRDNIIKFTCVIHIQ